MKSLRLFAFLPFLALFFIAAAQAQTIPQRANCVSAQASAAASVSCGPAAVASGIIGNNNLTGFTVMCGPASGSTSLATITIAGPLQTLDYYLQQSTTAVSYVAEDFTYPVVAPAQVAIRVTMPAVTNGGVCTCVACYVVF